MGLGLAEPRVRANTAPWTAEEDAMLKEGIRQGLPQTGNLAATAAGLHRRLNRRPDGIMQRLNALRRLDPEFDRFIRQHVRKSPDAPEDAFPEDEELEGPRAEVAAAPGAAAHANVPAYANGRHEPRPGHDGRAPHAHDGRAPRGGRGGRGRRRGRSAEGFRPDVARARGDGRAGEATAGPAVAVARRPEGEPVRASAEHDPERLAAELEAARRAAEAEAARRAVAVIVPWVESRLGELPEAERQRLARLVYDEGAVRVAVALGEAFLSFSGLLLARAEATLAEWSRRAGPAAREGLGTG